MSQQNVLVVEDEQKIANLLKDYLEQSGFLTHTINNGLGVIEYVNSNACDLILLDLMLPGKDGLEICKEIRQFSQIPIIMVTARVEEIDRLLGLEIGADDYVCKPFSPREVIARVKAVLRRSQNKNPQPSQFIQLNESKLEAYFLGKELPLTAIEFRILAILSAKPGQIFSRDQLIDSAYQDNRIVSGRTIDSHVKKLRKKLAEITEQEVIQSVYSVGYKFIVD